MKAIILALIITSTFVACKKSNLEEFPIIKKGDAYNMVNITGGIAGQNINIPIGTVTWELGVNTIKVNNTANNNIPTILKNGTYNFKFENKNNKDLLSVTDPGVSPTPQLYFLERNTSDSLVFYDGNADGFRYVLIR